MTKEKLIKVSKTKQCIKCNYIHIKDIPKKCRGCNKLL